MIIFLFCLMSTFNDKPTEYKIWKIKLFLTNNMFIFLTSKGWFRIGPLDNGAYIIQNNELSLAYFVLLQQQK